ncbi:MAG: hypothetical protein R3B95_01745 [Nitrospirales bacterium]|nr:hypothetical protein [Nitrospirales bacterium]
MVSQPGSASGRLNFSSPLKERGFQVRFSEEEGSCRFTKLRGDDQRKGTSLNGAKG